MSSKFIPVLVAGFALIAPTAFAQNSPNVVGGGDSSSRSSEMGSADAAGMKKNAADGRMMAPHGSTSGTAAGGGAAGTTTGGGAAGTSSSAR